MAYLGADEVVAPKPEIILISTKSKSVPKLGVADAGEDTSVSEL